MNPIIHNGVHHVTDPARHYFQFSVSKMEQKTRNKKIGVGFALWVQLFADILCRTSKFVTFLRSTHIVTFIIVTSEYQNVCCLDFFFFFIGEGAVTSVLPCM